MTTTTTQAAPAPSQTTPSSSGSPSTSSSSGSSSVQLKRSLSGKGYDAQADALAPSVQAKGDVQAKGTDAVHAHAAEGTKGSGGTLPHLAQIQKSFGAHDVSKVQAYSGGAAQQACEGMGAEAFATGDKVAFKGGTDLHTSAHEAAHIVQQREGVSLSGGVGKSGDSYEQNADQVADAVVAGKSAEGLLGKGGGGGGAGVQKKASSAKESELAGGVASTVTAPRDGMSAPVQRRESRVVQREGPGQAQPGNHTASAGSFEALSQRVSGIASGISSGRFANVTINVAFPVASVPGLEITIGVTGGIAAEANGNKELSCQLSGGVKYGLGRIFNINAAVSGSLQLTGADLGASLVDAVKQSLHVALRGAGVDARLNDAHGALNNPRTRAQRLLAWGVGEEWIATFNGGYRSYFEFFRNNGAVGFEASVAIQIGVAAEAGDRGGSITLEARTGIEDVGNRDAQTFGELAGQIQANSGNSQASVRFSKRGRSGGTSTVSIEVNGQVSMPRQAFSQPGFETFTQAFRTGMYLYRIYSCANALSSAREGANLREALDVAHSTASLGTATFGTSGQALDSLMGIELKVSRTGTQWTVDRARYKSMTQVGTGTGRAVAGVEANVQVGSFMEFSSVVNAGLAALGGS